VEFEPNSTMYGLVPELALESQPAPARCLSASDPEVVLGPYSHGPDELTDPLQAPENGWPEFM
jgi:hypothetical protein